MLSSYLSISFANFYRSSLSISAKAGFNFALPKPPAFRISAIRLFLSSPTSGLAGLTTFFFSTLFSSSAGGGGGGAGGATACFSVTSKIGGGGGGGGGAGAASIFGSTGSFSRNSGRFGVGTSVGTCFCSDDGIRVGRSTFKVGVTAAEDGAIGFGKSMENLSSSTIPGRSGRISGTSI